MRQRQVRPASRQKLLSREGWDFVRCRICGDHRRVISGRHLSKHEIIREEYMTDYGLSPDELIAKAFRVIQSSLLQFEPNGKAEWVVAVKTIYKKKRIGGLGRLQRNHPHLYRQGVWLFGGIDEGFRFAGFDPQEIRLHGSWKEARLHNRDMASAEAKTAAIPFREARRLTVLKKTEGSISFFSFRPTAISRSTTLN